MPSEVTSAMRTTDKDIDDLATEFSKKTVIEKSINETGRQTSNGKIANTGILNSDLNLEFTYPVSDDGRRKQPQRFACDNSSISPASFYGSPEASSNQSYRGSYGSLSPESSNAPTPLAEDILFPAVDVGDCERLAPTTSNVIQELLPLTPDIVASVLADLPCEDERPTRDGASMLPSMPKPSYRIPMATNCPSNRPSATTSYRIPVAVPEEPTPMSLSWQPQGSPYQPAIATTSWNQFPNQLGLASSRQQAASGPFVSTSSAGNNKVSLPLDPYAFPMEPVPSHVPAFDTSIRPANRQIFTNQVPAPPLSITTPEEEPKKKGRGRPKQPKRPIVTNNVPLMPKTMEGVCNKPAYAKAEKTVSCLSDEEIRRVDEQGMTMLHRAAESGNLEDLCALINRIFRMPNGLKLRDAQDSRGRTMAFILVEHTHVESIDKAVLTSFDIRIQGCPQAIPGTSNYRCSPLHLAATYTGEQRQILIKLLNYIDKKPRDHKRSALEAEDANGLTPLLIALKTRDNSNCHEDLCANIRLLLQHGANPLHKLPGSNMDILAWAARQSRDPSWTLQILVLALKEGSCGDVKGKGLEALLNVNYGDNHLLDFVLQRNDLEENTRAWLVKYLKAHKAITHQEDTTNFLDNFLRENFFGNLD